MSDKILSIIVPSYNMEAYLPKCLGSLLVDNMRYIKRRFARGPKMPLATSKRFA